MRTGRKGKTEEDPPVAILVRPRGCGRKAAGARDSSRRRRCLVRPRVTPTLGAASRRRGQANAKSTRCWWMARTRANSRSSQRPRHGNRTRSSGRCAAATLRKGRTPPTSSCLASLFYPHRIGPPTWTSRSSALSGGAYKGCFGTGRRSSSTVPSCRGNSPAPRPSTIGAGGGGCSRRGC